LSLFLLSFFLSSLLSSHSATNPLPALLTRDGDQKSKLEAHIIEPGKKVVKKERLSMPRLLKSLVQSPSEFVWKNISRGRVCKKLPGCDCYFRTRMLCLKGVGDGSVGVEAWEEAEALGGGRR
jgi:hypothetical protein